MKKFKEVLQKLIKERGISYKTIAKVIDAKEYLIQDERKHPELKFYQIENFMNQFNVEPSDLFEYNPSNQVNEPMSEYGRKKNDTKIDTGVSELDFLRSQVASLTKIIENLSRVIDTKNINH